MSYFGTTPARVNLRCLRLENCWEVGNQGVLNIAHGLPNLQVLSLSGCSKINDDAIEVIAEQLRHLTSLNLSWCSRISDASLEYIACDLADSLRELIVDRFVPCCTPAPSPSSLPPLLPPDPGLPLHVTYLRHSLCLCVDVC